jgi:UDP-N-acetylglucosamine 3-dehydrogenase
LDPVESSGWLPNSYGDDLTTASLKKRHRIAVVGLGVMGARHLRALQRLPERFDVVGGHDIDRQRGVDICAAANIPFFPSLEETLHGTEAVVLATTTDAHVELALQTCSQRRHLLIEKPMGGALEPARALVHAAAGLGVHLAVGLSERWNPSVRWLAKALFDDDLLSLHIERHTARGRSRENILRDLAIHDLDLCAFLSRRTIVTTRTLLEPWRRLQIDAMLPNGARATIDQSWIAAEPRRQITALTRRGELRCDLLSGQIQIRAHGRDVQVRRVAGTEPLVAQALAFADLLEGRATECVHGHAAIDTLAALERCEQQCAASTPATGTDSAH